MAWSSSYISRLDSSGYEIPTLSLAGEVESHIAITCLHSMVHDMQYRLVSSMTVCKILENESNAIYAPVSVGVG